MEQQLTRPRLSGPGNDGLTGAEGLEQTRASLDAILAEADRILDGLRPVNAEEYLQQNRQQGGE
jgi:hypothetical protein